MCEGITCDWRMCYGYLIYIIHESVSRGKKSESWFALDVEGERVSLKRLKY